MHLIGWHLLLLSQPLAGFLQLNIPPEFQRWDGEGWVSSLTGLRLPKHQQVLAVVMSVTVLVIRVCPCTVCKRHLAFQLCLFLKMRLILAPQQSPRLHGCRAPPEGCQAKVAQGTILAEDAASQRRVQMETGCKSAVWRWVEEEWTARVCVTDVRVHEVSCHVVENVAELSENTWRFCSNHVKDKYLMISSEVQRLTSTRTND